METLLKEMLGRWMDSVNSITRVLKELSRDEPDYKLLLELHELQVRNIGKDPHFELGEDGMYRLKEEVLV